MDNIDEALKRKVWKRGKVSPEYQEDHVRIDACGAWMVYEDYGNRKSPYGWEIDHIYPESKLKEKKVPQDQIDNFDNLRPLNWANNDSKSDDYPVYRAAVSAKDDKNESSAKDLVISKKVQERISKLYEQYGI